MIVGDLVRWFVVVCWLFWGLFVRYLLGLFSLVYVGGRSV